MVRGSLPRVLAVAILVAHSWVATAKEEKEEEEEEEVDPSTQAATVMIILSLMIAFSIAFETAQEKLVSNVRSEAPNLMPVVDSLFAELTLLGFIGLSLFIFDKLELVKGLSEDMFHEEGAIGELCESVHMALFLVMVIFMANVILLVQFGVEIASEWERWEDNILDKNNLLEGMASVQSAASNPLDLMRFTEPINFQKISYASIRNMFCADLDEHFSFADYLNRRLGFHLGELVEVPVKTWGGLWVFMFACYILHDVLPLSAQAVILVMIAYSLPVIMRHIHGKLRLIKYDACDLMLVAEAEQLGKQGGGVEEGSNLLSAGPAAGSGAIESAKGPVPTGPDQWWMHLLPIEYTVKGLETRYGRQSRLDDDTHHLRFWGGAKMEKEAPDFILSLIRYCMLVNSIYMAICVLMFFPAIGKSVTAGELGFHQALVIVLLAIVPPIALITLTPHTVKDFTVVSNIKSMKNQRTVEQTKRRMKTRFAFLVLKVIYMMLKGFEESNKVHTKSYRKPTAKEETVTQKIKKRKTWLQIFKVFDGGADGEGDEGDGDGQLTHAELHALLVRITGENSKFTEKDIQLIINTLDENGDGSIDFEEFFAYVTEITENTVESDRQISDGIFSLVDQPDAEEEEEERAKHGEEKEEEEGFNLLGCCEGAEEEEEEGPSISIKELQDMLELTGQNLPADEVLEIVSDIDVNGDGHLDKDEFYTLLRRLDVVM